jgi:hypothetical protein
MGRKYDTGPPSKLGNHLPDRPARQRIQPTRALIKQ